MYLVVSDSACPVTLLLTLNSTVDQFKMPRPPKRDPNKPKGKVSAYAFFVKERRNASRERGETVDFATFSRECANAWPRLPIEEKQVYTDMAARDKERYDMQMSEYEARSGGTIKMKKQKKPRDPNQPKRSM